MRSCVMHGVGTAVATTDPGRLECGPSARPHAVIKAHAHARILLGLLAGYSLAAAHIAAAHTRYSVLARISGPSGGWDYSTVDPSTNRLYLARDSGVLSMDLKTHTINPIAVRGKGVHIAEPVGKTGILLVTNGDTDTATIFDAKTDRLIGTIEVGDTPDAAVYDPSTRLVAVMNQRGGTVSLVNAAKVTLVRTIEVGGRLESAAPSGDGKLFLNVASKHEIAVLDLNAGTVLRRYVMKGCEDPSGLAYDASDRLIASVCSNGVTKVLRASDGTPVATLPTGFGSDGLIFDARRKLLFVPAPAENQLSVIQLGSGAPHIVQRLKIGPGARSGAIDPRTGLLYLPSAQLGPPKPPERWPSVIPGTFKFLVVGER